ncbi:uncharacterized protein MONBRDRAFT_17492 [Monosiga brevicollis MX1]|uniref:1,4-alpha-glucan branching enzyme n=1 Tax=Monosiga brevicollis TaxID=81824 RepID=A9URY2_MONBE|nr:uncharacterized protein MONBRDRAFT_17492 [Monosiga brevicollis MX1]EDQ91684.1 predicted protein [Monosiga brevicollis MX1]|eukprot:XP_001742970.1 hypothetical protein [Monosiga brevicollis MX1]
MELPPQFTQLLERDKHLRPHKHFVIERYSRFRRALKSLKEHEGGLAEFAKSYRRYGLHHDGGALRLREYLPGATAVFLCGEFNDWNTEEYPCTRDAFGNWTLELPDQDGQPRIKAGQRIKLHVKTKDGKGLDRIPAWITRAEPSSMGPYYEGVYQPLLDFQFKHARPTLKSGLKIYEAHVGIASPKAGIASYDNFTDNVLPRIAAAGYNAIQLMAVMEHAYYGSFGYQVTSFFAASSRYGPSEALCRLVDTAHGLGIKVLLDVVHSHASKNTADGLNMYDGTDSCYFHGGPRGHHPQWDSRLFNYSSWETLRFLLSNLRFYIEQYGFDGFRFDGVTSMLYTHHGLGRVFSKSQTDYFDGSVDVDAGVYLMLANTLVHTLLSDGLTIAEEVSGMPALCRPEAEGGYGFDYKLGMAIPDMWIKMLKEQSDEEWDMGNICFNLENRRYMEPTIAYVESHDQALVGDKTVAFWLMDKEMYTHMSVLSELTTVVDRGLALHKMIRLITHALGGEGYLNFIGNEFGHPEWLDFPREGNGESYQHARRQWNLVDDELLRYKFLNNFDKAMNCAEEAHHWLNSAPAFVSLKHEADKLIVFERNEVVFAFNFHAHKSYSDYRLGVGAPGSYQAILCTDDETFGGHQRIDGETIHFTEGQPWHERPHSMLVYLPARTAVAFARKRE